jgi:PAS domain S-box-containing protein
MEGRETTGPARVLVVEDEAIIAADLAETLISLGYDVAATVDTAEDAIVHAADLVPDIVLMDVRLAGALDGIEAAATIRQRADIPVIFLTAHSDDETLARASRVAPLGYLVKPFRASELRYAIELALHRHARDHRLAEHEHWLASTLRGIGDAVLATDRELRVTALSPLAQVLTGWSEAEALGAPAGEVLGLVGARTGAALELPLRRAIAAGQVAPLPDGAAVRARGGVATPIEGRAAPIVDDRGGAIGGVLVFRDATEQAQIEDAMRRLSSELKARVIDRTGPIPREASEPHRYPVEDHAALLPAASLEHLRRIRSASRRMGELLGALLQLVGAAQVELGAAEVDLSALARDILGALAPPGARITIQRGLVARGDRRLLRWALTHLLANARKFSARTDTPEIVVGRDGADGADGAGAYFVRDNGVGFDMAAAPRLFGAFQRLHPPTDFEGGGIGLAIVQRIVHRHGGRVWAEGEVGRGATFRFTLGQWTAGGEAPPPWPR